MSTAVHGTRPAKPSKWWPTLVNLALVVLFLVSAWGIAPNWERLVEAPATMLRYAGLMLGGLLNNPFAEPWSGVWSGAVEQMFLSVAMAWIGTLIAAALSLPLAFVAASNVAPRWVVVPVRLFLDLMRAIPDVLFAIVIFMPLFGLGPLAGAFALGVGSIGSLGKLSSEVVEGMSGQTIEAVRATGAGPMQVVRWGVLPQVMPEIVAFWLYRFEINIRAGAILGAIGVGGIGALLKNDFQDRNWDEIGVGLVVVIAITLVVDAVSARVRHRIIAGPASAPARAAAVA